jgi:hypothetical protein
MKSFSFFRSDEQIGIEGIEERDDQLFKPVEHGKYDDQRHRADHNPGNRNPGDDIDDVVALFRDQVTVCYV